MEYQAMSVKDIVQAAGVSRTTIYKEIKLGRLKITKIGRRSVILPENFKAWLAHLDSCAT